MAGAPTSPEATLAPPPSMPEVETALASEDARPLEHVVMQLAHLSPAAFRTITLRGLETCASDGQRMQCEIQPLGDGDIHDLQQRWPRFGSGGDPETLGPPSCTRDKEHAVCIATGASLGGMQWTFDRDDGAWRLVQVLTFSSSM